MQFSRRREDGPNQMERTGHERRSIVDNRAGPPFITTFGGTMGGPSARIAAPVACPWLNQTHA